MYIKNNILFPSWIKKSKNLICGFTSKYYGNQSFKNNNIPINTTKENRIKLLKILNINPLLVYSMNQEHTDNVIFVNENKIGKGSLNLNIEDKADSCISDIKNVLLITTWADCSSVIIFDNKKEIFANIHSGWKGTYLEIIKKTIENILDKGSNIEDLYVAIGPTIRGCCYEVGREFLDYFSGEKLKFFEFKNNKLYLDLFGLVFEQIIRHGVKRENIDYFSNCNFCSKNPELSSYRRDRKNYTAQATFIGVFDNFNKDIY